MLSLKCTQFYPMHYFCRGLAVIIDNFLNCLQCGQIVRPEVLPHITFLLHAGYKVQLFHNISDTQIKSMRENPLVMSYDIPPMAVAFIFSDYHSNLRRNI